MIKDFYVLGEKLDEGVDSSSLRAMMEQQVSFLSDITFDNLCASAAAAGSSVAARRHLWMLTWKVDASQKQILIKLPFSGEKLFGQQLEDLVKKSAENKKLMAPSRPASRGRGFFHKRPFGRGSGWNSQPFGERGRGQGAPSSDKSRYQPPSAASNSPTQPSKS